jgi:hypothetical protein
MSAADRVIRWSTALAVLGVALVAAVASYEHAGDLVRAHGEADWTARLIPLTVDGLIYVRAALKTLVRPASSIALGVDGCRGRSHRGAMSLRICQHVADDPMPMWRRYARAYPRTIREYDFGDRGDPEVLTEAEAWRSRIIRSNLTHDECDQVVQRGARLSTPWASVPADADLADADPSVPGGLFADMAELYWSFMRPEPIPRVKVAKLHKILHPKRPGLYPILDKRIKEFYEPCAAAWTDRLGHLGSVTIADSPPYWAAFREDLVRNRGLLEEYKVQIAEDEDETVRSMADLTCVRLQDIIAWMIAVHK